MYAPVTAEYARLMARYNRWLLTQCGLDVGPTDVPFIPPEI